MMPADTFTIPDDFAKDCHSLTSFIIPEPGNLVYDYSFGDRILANTHITSLTFPSSMSSLNVFSSKTLLGLNELAEIHFNGMTYEQLATAAYVEVNPTPPTPTPTPTPETPGTTTIEYDTHKIYYESTLDSMMTSNGITVADKSNYFIQKSPTELC